MTTPFAPPAGAVIDDAHVWNQTFSPPSARPRPALFLDRDGVVVEEVHYLSRPDDVRLIPGAAETVLAANRASVPVILVTNQAGIGRGRYGWDAFAAVQARLIADLARAGAALDGVFACPHHEAGRPPYDVPDHEARKPRPGMLLRAARLLAIDLARSWIVGDRALDLEAGLNAGLAGGLHVTTGYGKDAAQRTAALALAGPAFRASAVGSIADVPAHVPFLSNPEGQRR